MQSLQFIRDLLSALLLCAESQPASLDIAAALAGDLQCLASAVRFMEFVGDAGQEGQQPAFALLQAAYPMLSRVAASPTLCANLPILQAMCEVS